MRSNYSRQWLADKLLERLTNGPQFGNATGAELTAAEYTRQYRLWADTWILENVKYLVPELRTKHNPDPAACF